MPPAWDPPKLLLVVVSGLHVVVGSSSSSSRHQQWRLAPRLHRLVTTIRYRKGEKGEQSNREYSSKVLASKELHYICIGINERG